MPLTVQTVTTYTAACDTSSCTNTWSGSDPANAAGWVFELPAWQIGSAQPTATQVRCPSHA